MLQPVVKFPAFDSGIMLLYTYIFINYFWMLGDSCWCRFIGIEKGKEKHIAQESYKTSKKCQGIRLISSNFFSFKCDKTEKIGRD